MAIKKGWFHPNLHEDMPQIDKIPVSKISRDHQHGLVMSRRILDAIDKENTDFSALASQIVQFFDDYMVPHFAEEENTFFPAIEHELDTLGLVKELLEEHHVMRVQVTRFRVPGLEIGKREIEEFARNLERHIFKEEELFSSVSRKIKGLGRLRTETVGLQSKAHTKG
ncbi:MAG: Hemerythrin domain-containing protein [Bacteroidetes bacterium]|nr:Hemerythrin domain-containing protein [Bacteroidota bacterium]